MKEYQIVTELNRGKTKVVYSTTKHGVVILENLPNITANDDPNVTKQFEIKAVAATTTTCRTFKLLRNAGLPVAYIEQVSETSFAAHGCTMIPFEAVARRYAVGSFLKRHPGIKETNPPFRFDSLVTELFLKTSKGHCVLNGEDRDLGLDPAKGQEDPLLVKSEHGWDLFHAKMPAWIEGAKLGSLSLLDLQFDIDKIEKLLCKTFLVLEGAWTQLGWHIIDLKIEFGITTDGRLVVADVIDNDSWRLRDSGWNEMSKQVFRNQIADNTVNLDDISLLYQRVADLSGQLRIPKHKIIL